MATLLSRKSEIPKRVESQRGYFRSCVAMFVHPLPAALFLMILVLVWSSSTTYISGRVVHFCVSSRKLSNFICISATTQYNTESHLPLMNSTSQELHQSGISVLEEEVIPVLDKISVYGNLEGDSKELSNVTENASPILEKTLGNDGVLVTVDIYSKEVPNVVVDNSTTFLEKRVGTDGVEIMDELKGHSKEVSSTNPTSDRTDEIRIARKDVEEQIRVQRSWTTNQDHNQNPNQCEGRGIYVYELPPKFNKELTAQCHDMVPWVDMCRYFSNNAFGEPIPELGDRWFGTHQYSLEPIFHSRILNHPCRVYNESQGKIFYVPYYGGLDILRWHFKNVSIEIKDSLSMELVSWLELQKPWHKNLGKDHVFVLGKISWDFRRREHTSWGTQFLHLDEMQNPIKLMIERQPWHINDIGIPHPTHFHPQSDFDIRSWQQVIVSSHRRSLVSFAGAARPDAKDNIRSILIDQCTSKIEEQCKFFDCKSGLCDEPKPLIRLFMESEFCLQPPGDSPTRKSMFDSLVSGCIPVVFDLFTAYYQYPWHLPEDHGKYSVFVDQEEVRGMKVNVVERLMKVPKKERDDMRRYIVYELMPKLVYGDPDARFESFQDAFSITINSLIERVRILNLE